MWDVIFSLLLSLPPPLLPTSRLAAFLSFWFWRGCTNSPIHHNHWKSWSESMNLHLCHSKLPNSFLLNELAPSSNREGKDHARLGLPPWRSRPENTILQAGRPGSERAGGCAGSQKPQSENPGWGERLELSWDTEFLSSAWIAFVLGLSSLQEILRSG